MMRSGLFALMLLVVGGCNSSPPDKEAGAAPVHPMGAAAVDQQRLLNADNEPGSWLAAGRDYNEQRFSSLKQINDKNVGSINLGLSWYGDIDTERGQEATPVVVDGVLYVTSAWSLVKAYDIKTGRKIWEYDPKVNREKKGADACCDVVNRGVAAWNGKIYLGALDGRLIALDGKTGKEWHGRNELAEAAGGHGKGCNFPKMPLEHMVMNLVIEPTAEGAKGKSYLIYPGRNGKYVDDEHHGHDGGYQDTYVKTANGWRYSKRVHVFPPQLPGAYSGVPNDKLDATTKPTTR